MAQHPCIGLSCVMPCISHLFQTHKRHQTKHRCCHPKTMTVVPASSFRLDRQGTSSGDSASQDSCAKRTKVSAATWASWPGNFLHRRRIRHGNLRGKCHPALGEGFKICINQIWWELLPCAGKNRKMALWRQYGPSQNHLKYKAYWHIYIFCVALTRYLMTSNLFATHVSTWTSKHPPKQISPKPNHVPKLISNKKQSIV